MTNLYLIQQDGFKQKLLKAKQVLLNTQPYATTPCGVIRYNPVTDSGKGNKMWLTSTLTGQYKSSSDERLNNGRISNVAYAIWLYIIS